MENIAFKRACNLSTNHELSTISHIWFEETCFRKDNIKGLYEIKAEAQEEVMYLAPWPFRLSASGRNKYPSIHPAMQSLSIAGIAGIAQKRPFRPKHYYYYYCSYIRYALRRAGTSNLVVHVQENRASYPAG